MRNYSPPPVGKRVYLFSFSTPHIPSGKDHALKYSPGFQDSKGFIDQQGTHLLREMSEDMDSDDRIKRSVFEGKSAGIPYE
jgi:hypothetical protein